MELRLWMTVSSVLHFFLPKVEKIFQRNCFAGSGFHY